MADQELENTFGSDFASGVEEKIRQRQREREKVSEEDRAEIAHLAINENKFKDEEPTFTFKSDSAVTHDVLLMQVPNPNNKHAFTMVNELDSGAVTMPLNYLGEFMSCLFNDQDELKKLDEGDWAIVIGQMDQWEDDKGKLHDQVSPVRGVITLDEAREYADGHLSGDGTSDPDSGTDDSSSEDDSGEDMPDFATSDDGDEEEEEEEDDGSGSFLGGGDDEDEEEEDDTPDVEYDEVAPVVETLSQKDDAVWELEEGDDRLDKLTQIITKQLELEETEEVFEAVQSHALDRIAEEQEDEEDEEEEDALF